MEALYGLLLPFLGTSLGAASVFFMKKAMSDGLQKGLTGFAAGVMTAASVWSLLIPAIERSEELGKWSFAPAAAKALKRIEDMGFGDWCCRARPLQASGSAFCSCWRWTISFPICIGAARSRRAPPAGCAGPP